MLTIAILILLLEFNFRAHVNGTIWLAELCITFHTGISDFYEMATFLSFFSEVSEEDLEIYTKLFDAQ